MVLHCCENKGHERRTVTLQASPHARAQDKLHAESPISGSWLLRLAKKELSVKKNYGDCLGYPNPPVRKDTLQVHA